MQLSVKGCATVPLVIFCNSGRNTGTNSDPGSLKVRKERQLSSSLLMITASIKKRPFVTNDLLMSCCLKGQCHENCFQTET